jgi:hypothetical protein
VLFLLLLLLTRWHKLLLAVLLLAVRWLALRRWWLPIHGHAPVLLSRWQCQRLWRKAPTWNVNPLQPTRLLKRILRLSCAPLPVHALIDLSLQRRCNFLQHRLQLHVRLAFLPVNTRNLS